MKRCNFEWTKEHERLVEESKRSDADIVLIGDSIVRHYNKYPHVLKKYFKKAINLDISGDCTQHVLWRLKFGLLPLNAILIIVHIGTNDVG